MLSRKATIAALDTALTAASGVGPGAENMLRIGACLSRNCRWPAGISRSHVGPAHASKKRLRGRRQGNSSEWGHQAGAPNGTGKGSWMCPLGYCAGSPHANQAWALNGDGLLTCTPHPPGQRRHSWLLRWSAQAAYHASVGRRYPPPRSSACFADMNFEYAHWRHDCFYQQWVMSSLMYCIPIIDDQYECCLLHAQAFGILMTSVVCDRRVWHLPERIQRRGVARPPGGHGGVVDRVHQHQRPHPGVGSSGQDAQLSPTAVSNEHDPLSRVNVRPDLRILSTGIHHRPEGWRGEAGGSDRLMGSTG